MSYLGLTRSISRHYLSKIKKPSILEIGIDRGQTTLPLINNLLLSHEYFMYSGIDIRMRPEFIEQLSQFENISFLALGDPMDKRNIYLFEENSLTWLEKNKNKGIKFDLILLDGDHNYYTVSKELELLQNFIGETSIIVCDDYQGRYAKRDMFYANYDDYANNKLVTTPIESEKQGVSNAIHDFIKSSPINFSYVYFGELEPCILYNRDKIRLYSSDLPESGNIRDMVINFDFL